MAEGTLDSCGADGQQDCVTKGDFKALKTTIVSPDIIAHGATIAGITGTKRDMKQCRNAADLSTYDASYPPGNLPRTISAASMNPGTDIISLGGPVHGLLADAPVRLTTTDTLPAELTVGTIYYAIISSVSTLQLAATPGGPFIDFSSGGTGSHTFWDASDGTLAYFDTVDDYNNNSTSPSASPWGASYICNASNFTNVSAEVIPTGTTPTHGTHNFTQVWRDELTGLLFTNVLSSTNHAKAIPLCENLNGSSAGTGWRLPTQKELMQLYINGVAKVPFTDGASVNSYFRSATVRSDSPSVVWVINLSNGFSQNGYPNYADALVFCVR